MLGGDACERFDDTTIRHLDGVRFDEAESEAASHILQDRLRAFPLRRRTRNIGLPLRFTFRVLHRTERRLRVDALPGTLLNVRGVDHPVRTRTDSTISHRHLATSTIARVRL